MYLCNLLVQHMCCPLNTLKFLSLLITKNILTYIFLAPLNCILIMIVSSEKNKTPTTEEGYKLIRISVNLIYLPLRI